MANTDVPRQPDAPFDLTILYMEDARSWCEYLFDIFQPYEVYQNSEEITNFPSHETTLNNIKESRVVIVIVSPVFLDHIDPLLHQYTDQVVALLCGVSVDDLKCIETSIPSSKNWKIVEALSGQRNITQVTLKLLDGMDSDTEELEEGGDYIPMTGPEPEETYLPMEGRIKPTDDIYLPMVGGNIQEPEDEYTTMGDTMAPLVEDVYEPMTSRVPEDTYEIIPSGKGPRMPPGMRAHEFAPKRPAYINEHIKSNTQYSEGTFITPSTVRSGTSEPLFIIFTTLQISTRPEDLYKALFKSSRGTFNVVAIVVNQCTLRINRLPEGIIRGSVTVEVLHNSKPIATLQLTVQGPMDVMSDLLRTITNPFEFMCEALNISPADSNTLDNVLFEHCNKHLPHEGAESFHRVYLTTQETEQDSPTSEVPTVLHFAAKYGLKMMCSMLLNLPGAYQAMKTKNCNGDTPSVLAEKSGDESLKEFLENYLELAGSEGIQHPDEIGGAFETDRPSYVYMTGDVSKKQHTPYVNKAGIKMKSDYDRPFPVPIPAGSSPFMRDDTIKSLVSGNENDIYDYYDNQTCNFQRDEDEDDDDENGADYEDLEEQNDDLPPSRLPPKPASLTSSPSPKEDTEVMGNVRITPMEELNRTPKSNIDAGIPKDQQALIDLQNMVKNNQLSVEDAVSQFKDLQRQDQLSFRESGTMRDSVAAKKSSSNFNFFKKKKDVFYSFSEILREKRGQSTFYTGSQDANGVAARGAGNVSTPARKLRTRSDPVAVGRDPQWLPSIPERYASKVTTHNKLSTSKSVGVGVYDKPRAYQMQDRYVEGVPSPTLSPTAGRTADRFNQHEDLYNRPISTVSTLTSGSRTTTLASAPNVASLAAAASSFTLPIFSYDENKTMMAGTGSRNSTLSTGSRDSSYGSAAEPEIDESEADPASAPPPSVARRGGENRKTSKGNAPAAIPTSSKAPAAIPASSAATGQDHVDYDQLPMPSRDAPPPPRGDVRRSSDPTSPPPQKPRPQPRPQPRPRRVPPQTENR
ncbi:uncharacterized protein [Amphiura filiformis]|uniref:uncharacterized protein isoform X2 n=1 Tax=Amphiura filiformis TaxID=82378 RepID=UPI003B226BE6